MPEEITTVKMIRSEEMAQGGPTEADVHPDEISNYARGGWVRDDTASIDPDDKKGKK